MKGSGKGLGAIKGLLLEHGEKIGMGLVVLIAGYFIYSAIGLESLPADKAPTQLESLARQVDSKVGQATWELAQQQSTDVVKLYTPLATGGGEGEISRSAYALTGGGLDRAVVPQATLRTDPRLLPPKDFEVHGLTGLFAFISEEQRQNRQLEEARRERERERDRLRDREEADRQAERGTRGRNRPGAASEGGALFDSGSGQIDPNNKNIRIAGITLRPSGVPLQGDELIQMTSCAVVVAKVPITEQFQEYKNTLADARGGFQPEQDFPNYLGYIVERAEVVPGQELQWKQVLIRNGTGGNPLPVVSYNSLPQITHDWAGRAEDTHDPRYTHPLLTFPQPPLVMRDWGEMAKLSEVKFAAEIEPEDPEDELLPGAGPGGGDPDDPFAMGPDAAFGEGPRRGGGGEFGPRTGGAGRFGGGGEFSRGGGRPRGGGGMMGEGGYSSGVGTYTPQVYTPKIDPVTGDVELDVPYLMFRFFDLSVQPGKRYKYRVRLALADVNAGRSLSDLDPAVIERLKTRRSSLLTDWSEPSPTVSIPQAGAVQVAEAKPPTAAPLSEITVKLIVEGYGVNPENRSEAVQGYVETEARRGTVLNFFRQPVDKLIQQGRYIETVEDFTIDTGITVLDVDGGDRYTRELQSPSQVLFMDPTGRMYLRDELDDEIGVAFHRALFTPPDDRRGSGRGEAFGPEGGGRGGGRRGGGGGSFFGP